MIPRKLAITQHSKVQDSSKSENSRKKHPDRKRRHRKGKINLGHNKQVGRTTFERFKAGTEELQRQEDNLLLQIGEAKKPGTRVLGRDEK